jgi:hypothetical protein
MNLQRNEQKFAKVVNTIKIGEADVLLALRQQIELVQVFAMVETHNRQLN